MACGWPGGGREGNYLLGERPLHGVARYSPSTGTEASHCSQWSRGIAPVTLTVVVLIPSELDPRARKDVKMLLQYFDSIADVTLCIFNTRDTKETVDTFEDLFRCAGNQ